MLLDGFPATTAVELHPVILSIFNLTRVFQGLGEQIPQEVVVRGVFESEVSNIAKILVELL
jgi:hypothetical protein